MRLIHVIEMDVFKFPSNNDKQSRIYYRLPALRFTDTVTSLDDRD